MLTADERWAWRDDVALAAAWLKAAVTALPVGVDGTTLVALALGALAARVIVGMPAQAAVDGALRRLRGGSAADAAAADPLLRNECVALAARLDLDVPVTAADREPAAASGVGVDDILFADESSVAAMCRTLEVAGADVPEDVALALSARAFAELRRQRLMLGTQIVRLQLRRGYDPLGALDAIRFLRTQQRVAGHFGGAPAEQRRVTTAARSVSEVVHTAVVLACYEIVLAAPAP